MLTDYENIDFNEEGIDVQSLFTSLLGEAKAIKANADRALTQRKNDQASYRSEIDELKTQIQELSKSKEDLENKGLINENNYEELLSKQTEKMRLTFEEKLDDITKRLEESENSRIAFRNKYNSEKINNVLIKAAEKAGVLPTAIDDVVFRANGVFSVSDDGDIEARDSEGNLRKLRNKQLTPEVFVTSLKDSAPHLWPVSQSAGAGGSGNGVNGIKNPFDKKSGGYSLTEQAKLLNENPDLAKEMQQAASSG